uniref:Uncharacterized protein n=1 Tax=Physcomitrium patens TaxID=3218 RepID=A0A2K1IQU5_PHYPA|nr:hypothetical protein PHYPA_025771 [Physcomitrium patens]
MWRDSYFSRLAIRSNSFIITNTFKWNCHFFYSRKLYLRNNKLNFTIFSKKNNNYFISQKKNLKKNKNYQKIKLKKKFYKGWEKIDYTFFISYTN